MKSLGEELDALFLDHPDGEEARAFLHNAGLYFHMVDDLIDGDLTNTPENLGTTLITAINIYSCDFYNKYARILYPVIRNIHHTYFDTVKMERSSEQWKREYSAALKSVGQDLTLTIIEILGGYPKRRELSQLVREFSYSQQGAKEVKEIE